MKNLKNKIFITIFSILTISLITVLVFYHSSDYLRERNKIKENLMFIKEEKEMLPPKEDIKEPPKFMDTSIYTFEIENNSIKRIINHSRNNNVNVEIQSAAIKIINTSSKKVYIGNLIFNKYSYKYDGNNLIIIDNTDLNKTLQEKLLLSLLLVLILEIVFYFLSKNISGWIIKPAKESFERQKQFIADASHELKTPLSVIMASAEALEHDKDKKWLNNIKQESERMNKLIIDLLDLAKLESEDYNSLKKYNNISKLTEKALLPLDSLIFENKKQLNYNLGNDIYLNCNAEEYKQLINILMDNAIKHCPKNKEIKVNLINNKDIIILEVINDGDPIPEGEEEKIFERFYRVDKARNRKENRYGLGLAIAKQIVEQTNGTIRAYSKEGKTTFEVKFKK